MEDTNIDKSTEYYFTYWCYDIEKDMSFYPTYVIELRDNDPARADARADILFKHSGRKYMIKKGAVQVQPDHKEAK